MELHRFASGPELLARCHDFLAGREITHSLLLAIATRATALPSEPTQAPYLATVQDHETVHAIAICTPPHQLVLSDVAPTVLHTALDCVVDDLRAHGVTLPGAGGPVGVADVFAARWASAHGSTRPSGTAPWATP